MANSHRGLLAAAVITASLLSSGSAFAQARANTQPVGADSSSDKIDDIIVTARRSEERLQDTPIAVTAISKEQLVSTGSFQPERLGMLTPGLHVTVNVNNRDQIVFNIRGQSPEYNTLFPSVIPYFSEVPLQSLTRGQFYDLDSLQVLRGPQGVRFGRVTNGGAVLLGPKRPSNELGGYIDVKGGTHNLRALQGAITVPIIDGILSVRGAFDVTRRKGYTLNLVTGRHLDDEHSESGRFGVLFTPMEGLESYTVYQYSNINANGTSSALTDLNLNSVLSPALSAFGAAFAASTIQQLQAAFARQQARGVRVVENGLLAYGPDGGMRSKRHSHTLANITTLSLTDNLQVKNIFGYQKYLTRDGLDIDGTGVPLIDQPDPFAPVLHGSQISDEVQVNGKFFDKRLDISIGAYFDHQKPIGPQEKSYIVQLARVQRASILLADTKSKAVYASGEFDLSPVLPGLKINGGIRRTRDTVRARSATYQFIADPTVLVRDPNRPIGVCVNYGTAICRTVNQKSTVTTYEMGASYKIGDVLLYAAYRKGYRPGGVNTTIDPSQLLYGPEGNKEIELGVKADLRLGSMPIQINLAGFADNYSNIQKAVTSVFMGALQTNTVNTADGRVKGIEYEVIARPTRDLRLGVSGAYTDAKYKRGTADLLGPTGACNRNAFTNIGFCTLSKFLATPKFTITTSFDYTLPISEDIGKISIGADYYHQSASALTPRSYVATKAVESPYGLLNLNVSWVGIGGKPIDLRIFATNVTNKVYRVAASALNYRSSLGTSADTFGEPRMIGASLRYRFGADAL